MKKTLPILLLFATLGMTAFAVSLDTTVLAQSKADNNLSSSITLSGNALFEGDFTVSAKLNVGKLASSLVKGGSTNGASYGFVSMANADNARVIGTFTGYSSKNNIINSIGLYASSCTANTANVPASETFKALTANTSAAPFDIGSGLGTVDWSHVLEASLTLSYDASSCTSVYLTLGYDNGVVTNYYGSNTKWHWSSGTGNWTTLEVNTNVVDSVYLMKGAATRAEAININEHLIPEPATATLSLLALAGLATRRRRR